MIQGVGIVTSPEKLKKKQKLLECYGFDRREIGMLGYPGLCNVVHLKNPRE